ncbi:MAG: histidine triad nucleotide-binding protein [Nitrospinota bacterium]
MAECLLCRIIAGELGAKKVYEDEEIVAFEDINPQAPTHVLIVPKKHKETLLELAPEDRELIGNIYLTANRIARERGIAESGFRVVANCNRHAGQSLFHIHFHLLGGRPFGWPPG